MYKSPLQLIVTETYTSSVKEETLAHILCECEALASLRRAHLGSFFLEPEDIKITSVGAICGFSKATRAPII